MDAGREVVYPVVEALGRALETKKLIIGTGGGVRSRHVFSIGLDLGLPTGVLAQLAMADALGTAHMLGALLAPYGVVAIPPEIFGHLLPLFIHAAPGVIFNGVPPYSLWEHPPSVGRIPPHRSDAGCFLLAECFGCRSLILRSSRTTEPPILSYSGPTMRLGLTQSIPLNHACIARV